VATGRRPDLPFADKQFDLVVCQFGVMFFPDKPCGVGKPGWTLLNCAFMA
jgi:ubiquinone/menaquinone biosynthesis C-methylase UbiE